MRRSAIALGLTVVAALGVATAGAVGSPPPGATAVCRDGSYSFSQTHSGTCSHHGGVAEWLDAASSAPPASSGGVAAGATILLSPRTKTRACTRGANPDRACSPGAYYAKLTAAVVCATGFHTSSIRHVTESERHAVELEYGLQAKPYGPALEIDHVVPLELGGSNDIANLFPERAAPDPGFHEKDRLENRLHALVCAGSMTLRAAHAGIASNWQLLYRQVYGAAP
jgi:Protein of unknown function (DUF3761)